MANAVSRAEWGARAWRRQPIIIPPGERKYFVVHYPGAGAPPGDVRDFAKWCENIHMSNPEFIAIGYNYVVSGGRAAVGRGRDVLGGHSPPRNRDGIGVCVRTVNGVPAEEDLRATRALYDQLNQELGRKLTVWWHGRDYATECPGSILRDWARKGMPVPPVREWDEMASKQEIFEVTRQAVESVLHTDKVAKPDGKPEFERRVPVSARGTWTNSHIFLHRKLDRLIAMLEEDRAHHKTDDAHHQADDQEHKADDDHHKADDQPPMPPPVEN